MLIDPDVYGSLTFQILIPETNNDETDVDSKFFFCLQIVD